VAARRRSTARAAALPARADAPMLARFAPSRRSVLVGLGLFVAAAGLYLVARQTSLFAVSTLDVRGGTPAIRAEVRAALAGDEGRSLLRVDRNQVAGLLAGVPDVSSFRYDRHFPHTLRVTIRPERAALVLRRGPDAFLVSTTGRVLRRLPHPRASSLPRVWVRARTRLAVGEELSAADGAAAAAAVAAARAVGFRYGVRTITGGAGGLALVLPSGFEVRLGDPGDLRLKLTIAGRILTAEATATAGAGYLDVSVPERPVLSANSQVEG
jgi:cell division protein FtsQ